MFRIALAFLFGFALCAVLGWAFVIPEVRSAWRSQGANEGAIDAKWAIAGSLKELFPASTDGCEPVGVVFEVKTRQVNAVRCQGTARLAVVD